MKLRKYIEELNKLTESNPEYMDIEVIYSTNEEGNGHHTLHYSPSPCRVNDFKEYYLEISGFLSDGDISIEQVNAILIN